MLYINIIMFIKSILVIFAMFCRHVVEACSISAVNIDTIGRVINFHDLYVYYYIDHTQVDYT